MAFEYNGFIHRDLEPQVRYDAEQVQLLKQADVTINENLQTINESLQTINTEINGKLTKPTNPSAESAVTMLADGTVGTKLLSEIGGGSGGGKLYMHRVTFGFVDDKFTKLNIDIPSNTTDSITVDFLRNYIQGICSVSYNGSLGKGVVMLYCLPNSVVISGTAVDNGITEIININHSNADGLIIDGQTLIEL